MDDMSDSGRVRANEMPRSDPCRDDVGIQHSLIDLDDAANLRGLMRAVQSFATQNFVVDFTESTARTGFDLPATSITAILEADRSERQNICWVNIWYPYRQRALLELLAKRYDFSPRLLALMSSDPKQRRSSSGSSLRQQPNSSLRRRRAWRLPAEAGAEESQAGKELDELSEQNSISSDDSIARGNLYRIVDDLWHYSSVDFGNNFICIGYNSLYGTKGPGNEAGSGILPHCVRVWSWLILCADNTVISISEDPFPFVEGGHSAMQQRILAETRRNLVNIFQSLSKARDGPLMTQRPMTMLPIRTRLGENQEATISDAPGLLFYYLFENWHNSYTLVTRKESRYSVELSDMRAQMLAAPQLSHIDRLDTIGKELGALKRHYQSHGRIIERLTSSAASPPTAVLRTSHILNPAHHSSSSNSSLSTIRPTILTTETETETVPLGGVVLPAAARSRFQRLKDLVDLYALSEVDDYLRQKDAMIAMNFSLIAIKESIDVERLTRATLLLTKVSILFLPVSLLTNYFSIQTIGLVYTLEQYWVSFAVTLFVSWLALFILGVFSGNLQTVAFLKGCWLGLCSGSKWAADGLRSF